jgi:uncharacterized protein
VILVDTNIWLALALSKHQFHQVARRWFAQQSADHSVLFCRLTQLSFLRLLTTQGVMRLYELPALTNAEAWTVYDELLAERRCGWATENAAADTRLHRFTSRNSVSPKLWADAYLAALAITEGYKLLTADKGFLQFAGLDVIILSNDRSG